jgi:hypothetical protein
MLLSSHVRSLDPQSAPDSPLVVERSSHEDPRGPSFGASYGKTGGNRIVSGSPTIQDLMMN